jgi:hypothetical protein
MQRAIVPWLLAFALLFAGFGATVVAVNNDVLSAHGFVRTYLDALARHDAAAALETPGVDIDTDNALVVDEAVGRFSDIRFLSDTAVGDLHTVRYSYDLDGTREFTDFTVQRTGTYLALFSSWAFADSPVALLEARADHDSTVTVNGVPVASGKYSVLVPGLYVVDDDTQYFDGEEDAAPVTDIDQTVTATVKVTATPAFDAAATAAVDAFLDDCATQHVLMPTACPFGKSVNNRLDGLPSWSVTDYPTLSLTPESDAGVWRARASGGAVTVTARVQSLFDGSVSALEEAVPLRADYRVQIGVDGQLTVSVHP